ncbi:MAG: hypothetical protein COW69_01500 [Candidatus Huberarchaeum crystalense]|uniref:Uncharacterized protein n=1 Tax=Huberarchaeum crystalense TaxID=2014257 RepID=A0A2G9LJ38_HUBC1|nr:MAG: hypothetical protein COW69_01500 [Candidatus Huberarchaeum crystalense]
MVDFTIFLQPLYPVLIAIFFMALLYGVLSASKIFSASIVTNAILSATFGLLVLLVAWNTNEEAITGFFGVLPILLIILLITIIILGMFGIDMKTLMGDFNLKYYLERRSEAKVTGLIIKGVIYPLIIGFIFWFLIEFVFVPLKMFEVNPITSLLHAFFTPDIFITIVIIISMIALMWYFVKSD